MPGGDRLSVVPTETVPVVAAEAGQRLLRELRWWLVPSWSTAPDTRYAMFDARYKGPACLQPQGPARHIEPDPDNVAE